MPFMRQILYTKFKFTVANTCTRYKRNELEYWFCSHGGMALLRDTGLSLIREHP